LEKKNGFITVTDSKNKKWSRHKKINKEEKRKRVLAKIQKAISKK